VSGEKRRITVCRCEDITLEEIEDAINKGFTTLEDLKHLLKCGMGPCQGRTCMRLIARILARKTGRRMEELKFPRARPPIRPVPLAVFTAEKRSEG